MKRWLLLLLVLLGAITTAWADSTGGGGAASGHLPETFTDVHAVANKTDMSLQYLGEIFGNVGGLLAGGGSELTGRLFYVLNQGILVVAGLWLSYTVVTIFFTAAMDGAFNSPQKKVGLILLRIALGVSLLIPNPGTGYSGFQDITMKVVVEAVGLADEVWDNALDYFDEGGFFVKEASGVTTNDWREHIDGHIANTATKQPDAQSKPIKDNIMSQIFSSLVCMYASNYYAEVNTDNKDSMPTVKRILDAPLAPIWIPNAPANTGYSVGGVAFPGVGATDSSLRNKDNVASNNQCGQYVANDAFKSVGASKQNTSGDSYQGSLSGTSYMALRQMVLDLMPAAKQEACMHTPGMKQCDTPSNQSAANAASIYTSITDYNQVITPYIHGIAVAKAGAIQEGGKGSNSAECWHYSQTGAAVSGHGGGSSGLPGADWVSSNDPACFIPDAKAMGWLSAGQMFWNLKTLSSINNLTATGSKRSYYPTQDKSAPVFSSYPDEVSTAISGANIDLSAPGVKGDSGSLTNPNTNHVKKIPTVSAWTYAMYNAGVFFANFYHFDADSTKSSSFGSYSVQASDTGAVDTELTDQTFIPSALASAIKAVTQGFIMMLNTAGSPFDFFLGLGQYCLAAAGHLYDAGMAAIISLAVFAGLCSCVSPLATIFNAWLSWLEPLIMMIGGMLFVAGFMMSYYIPLYPWILFMFGALNWMITVIEVMVAAPLVCFGMTHPEGHDFLGRAEQALMLFLGVFLRPSLMVIGFLMAMVLSYVGFAMLQFGFTHMLMSIYGYQGNYSGLSGHKVTTAHQGMFGVLQYAVVSPDMGGVNPQDINSNTSDSHMNSGFLGHANVSAGDTKGRGVSASPPDTSSWSNYSIIIGTAIPTLCIMFGLILFEIVSMCFSLTYVLPDTVLRWIGGPVSQDRTEQAAKSIQGGVSSSAKQGIEASGKAGVGAAKGAGQSIGSPGGAVGQAVMGAAGGA